MDKLKSELMKGCKTLNVGIELSQRDNSITCEDKNRAIWLRKTGEGDIVAGTKNKDTLEINKLKNPDHIDIDFSKKEIIIYGDKFKGEEEVFSGIDVTIESSGIVKERGDVEMVEKPMREKLEVSFGVGSK